MKQIGGNPAGKYSVAARHCSRGAKKSQNIFSDLFRKIAFKWKRLIPAILV